MLAVREPAACRQGLDLIEHGRKPGIDIGYLQLSHARHVDQETAAWKPVQRSM